LYKLKQKRQQHTDAATAEEHKHSEHHRSKDATSHISAAASFKPMESHKRKNSSDDAGPGKKSLKFSSLFTNNPEIPHIDRCHYYF